MLRHCKFQSLKIKIRSRPVEAFFSRFVAAVCCVLMYFREIKVTLCLFFFPEFVMEQMKREEGGAQGWLLTSENLKKAKFMRVCEPVGVGGVSACVCVCLC